MFQSWLVIGLFSQMASGSFLHLWVDPAVRFLLTQFTTLVLIQPRQMGCAMVLRFASLAGPRWLLYTPVFSFLGQPYKIAHWYFVKVFMDPSKANFKSRFIWVTGLSEWVSGLGIWVSRLGWINGLLNSKFCSSNLISSGICFQGCWAVKVGFKLVGLLSKIRKAFNSTTSNIGTFEICF